MIDTDIYCYQSKLNIVYMYLINYILSLIVVLMLICCSMLY